MDASIEQVKANLEKRGYWLINLEEFPEQDYLPLNSLFEAIVRVYPERKIVNGLPVLLANSEEDEIRGLAAFSQGAGLANPAGYVYSTVADCLERAGKGNNSGLLRECAGLIVPEEKEFVIPRGLGPEYIKHLRASRRTGTAERWNVVDHDRDAEFVDIIKKYL